MFLVTIAKRRHLSLKLDVRVWYNVMTVKELLLSAYEVRLWEHREERTAHLPPCHCRKETFSHLHRRCLLLLSILHSSAIISSLSAATRPPHPQRQKRWSCLLWEIQSLMTIWYSYRKTGYKNNNNIDNIVNNKMLVHIMITLHMSFTCFMFCWYNT